MKKILILLLSVALSCSIMTACKKDKTKSVESETSSTQSTDSKVENEVNSESEKPVATGVNFLTGEPLLNSNASGKRPVAVMVNNIKTSLPQYGIEAADIVYEIPVEGGITRLMAVYSDYTNVPKVCSIRSCRYYYPLIALGMDAIYIHWGSDPSIARDTLNRTGIDRLEGGMLGAEYFCRDAERLKTYSKEHTGYLDGSRLPDAIEKFGYRKERSQDYGETAFSFSETQIVPSETVCTTAKLSFSKDYFSTFTYDDATQTYKKQHSGQPHIDISTGNQLSFKNVIVLKTNIVKMSNSVLMDVDLTNGTGKYISNGAVKDILWSKAGENSPIVLTNSDGTVLQLNQGKSYIAFIGKEKVITIS